MVLEEGCGRGGVALGEGEVGVGRGAELVEFVFDWRWSVSAGVGEGMGEGRGTTSHRADALRLELIQLHLQHAARTHADRLEGVGVVEGDEEEGHIILPRYASEGAQVGDGDEIAVSILLVADLELLEVGLVVHVPAEDDGAEAEAVLGYAEELLLRDELAAELAVDVEAGELDGGVIFEEGGEGVEGDDGF